MDAGAAPLGEEQLPRTAGGGGGGGGTTVVIDQTAQWAFNS